MQLIPDPFPYDEAFAIVQMRTKRDGLLAASDWTQMPDVPLTDEQRAAWATYRQALRDAPATWTPGPTWDAPDPPA